MNYAFRGGLPPNLPLLVLPQQPPWWPTATEGASKLRISMVAVKTDTHCLSFVRQPDGLGGLLTHPLTWQWGQIDFLIWQD